MRDVLESESIDDLNDINYDILSIFQKFKTLEIANAVMTKFTPLESFSSIADNYLAPVEPLIDAGQVNEWCNKTTHGKIDNFLKNEKS